MLSSLSKLSNDARVWIYQSNEELSPFLYVEIKTLLRDFLEEWTAHNQALLTFGDVYHNRFIVIMVDESSVGASGCSIDKSTHFIESLETHYGISLMDRQSIAYLTDENLISVVPLNDLKQLFVEKRINEETLFFNNLVKNKEEWSNKWKTPLKDCWIKRFV